MSGSVSGVSAGTMYALYSKNEQSYVTKFKSYDPATKAAIAYFQKQAPTITSAAGLLKDYKSLQVVLGAFGMSSSIQSTALLKQLMTQDPTSSSSLAQRMGNPAYLRFAKFMSQWNPPALSDKATVNVIVNGYATNSFETNQDSQNPGLQAALYFKRTASSVTSIAGIMSDPTLTTVVRVAAGLPTQFGMLDYTQQVPILSKAVDVKRLQDPKYVDQVVQRYLALNQPNTSASTTGVLGLFNGGASGSDLIGTIFSGSLLSTTA